MIARKFVRFIKKHAGFYTFYIYIIIIIIILFLKAKIVQSIPV